MKRSALLLKSLFLLLPAMLAALEITPAAPKNGSQVPLLNPQQKAYVTMPRAERISYFASAKCRKQMVKAGYVPLAVEFSWKSDAPAATVFRVAVSETPDMKDPQTVPGKDGKASVDNLKIAQTYYWQVLAETPDKKIVKSAVQSFRTEDQAPRLVRFPNVPNVRDLGGRKTIRGMRVKQNRIFRTAGMNFNAKWLTAKNDRELFASRPETKPVIEFLTGLEKAEKLHEVPYALNRNWTVFLTEKTALSATENRALDELKSIPAELFGIKGKVMTANSRDRLSLPRKMDHQTAVLMQEFDSPADGVMQLASGGDWYWNVRVNGKLVYTKIYGNMKSVTTSNYIYLVPVRKGKNLMTVTLQSSAYWMWCCGKRKSVKLEKIIKDELEDQRKTSIGWTPGANRITPEGFAIFRDKYGIRSDIDLRSDRECMGMTGSPMGPSVKWFHISSSAYGGMQTEFGKKAFTEVFKVFLDEKNYPVVFHCIAGQDRTGAVAFILNGLLGVPEEELYLDWEVTGFWNPSSKFNHELRFDHLVKGFMDKVPGKTLHEKIENYVLSLGFSRKDIEHFRAMMLEKQ